jgi:hypothetical protein
MSMTLPTTESTNTGPQTFSIEPYDGGGDFEFELTPLRTTIMAGPGELPKPCCQCVVGCVVCYAGTDVA